MKSRNTHHTPFSERLLNPWSPPPRRAGGRGRAVGKEGRHPRASETDGRTGPRLPVVTPAAGAGEPQAFGQRRCEHDGEDGEIEGGQLGHAPNIMSIAQISYSL